MKKLKTALIIIILLILSLNHEIISQDIQFDSLISAGIQDIYNIEFEKAEKSFLNLEQLYPEHPAGPFFLAMITWWKIRLDMQDEKYDDLFFDQAEEIIDYCDEILDKDEYNPYAYFFKGGALGFRGWLRSIREDWFGAALDGKEALPLVYKSYEIDSSNVDAILGFGIYNYYADVIPEKYPFVEPVMIFLPKGDRDKGIEQLKLVAETGKFAKYEALYFLMNIAYSFEENFDESLKYAEELVRTFPNNPVFEKYIGRSFVKKGDYVKAAKIFYNILLKSYANKPGYNDRLKREAAYYVGNNYFNQNKPDSAVIYFTECELVSKLVDEDEETGFQISAALMAAKSFEKSLKYEKAKEKYRQILEMREFRNSHQESEEALERLEELTKVHTKKVWKPQNDE